MSIMISGPTTAGMSSVMSGASMHMPPQQKMSNLYSQIDTSGSGSISQSQFNQAFQTMNPPAAFRAAGSNAVWNALDPSGTGQVSQQNFVNGMKNLMVQLRQGDNSISPAQTSTASTQALNTAVWL
jgi:Ca2+-binding EF-hand superfamily protein